ncbi:Uncharacterized oxidoreductase SE_2036 [Durusdinium trenchii]|uniref:Uncharacterized oxidoreductase SE_2036 n=1 Tax=Durusdinium trenchii TaxID=1381693 RepID=A0ABP0PVU2_9DINO
MDALFNCAGILTIGRFDEIPLARQNKIIEVNCQGIVNMTFAAMDALKAARGRVVSMASASAVAGIPMHATYAATKAFVYSMTEAWRSEFASEGVRFADVSVSYVKTNMTDSQSFDEGLFAEKKKFHSTNDVAATVWHAVHNMGVFNEHFYVGNCGLDFRLAWFSRFLGLHVHTSEIAKVAGPRYREMLKIIGADGSPYSLKVRAAFRSMHAPHVWARMWEEGNDWSKFDKLKAKVIPVVVRPDGTYTNDSTPLLQELDAEHAEPGRSIFPSNAGTRFISLLLEDFFDEWMTKVMFEGRFHTPEDAFFGAAWQVWQDPGNCVNPELRDQAPQYFADRQRERRDTVVGCSDWGVMEHTMRETCRIIQESVFAGEAFILGDAPTVADFALYGQMAQWIFDPLPAPICYETPAAVSWVRRIDDLSGFKAPSGSLDVKPGDLPAATQAFLTLCGKTYLPFLLENDRCVANNSDMLEVSILGGKAVHKQRPFKYQQRCLRILREEFAKLSGQDLEDVSALLRRTGCADAFLASPKL